MRECDPIAIAILKLGDKAWRDLLDAHDRAVRDELARFRGHEVKSLGDGFLATFDGPGRAIRCAKAICEAVSNVGFEVRVGVHTGEVEVTDDDVRGVAVHIASRIGSLGEANDVLVSRTVTDLVSGSGFCFQHLGTRALKGLPEQWDLYKVVGPPKG